MDNIPCVLKPVAQADGRNDRIIEWNTFFRKNIQYFIELYFGIVLYDYQKIQLYEMGNRISTTIPASRATAKSWIAAVFGCAYCVLYPGTKCVIASPTKGQSSLMLKTIESLMRKHFNLAREIEKIKTNKDDSEVVFYNSSTITVVPLAESGRGYRANLIIIEETASTKKKWIDEILLPFSAQRTAPFRQLSKYKNIQEDTKKIYIGSIKEKTNWFYKHCLQQMQIMTQGDPLGILLPNQVSILILDYLTSLIHGIKTKQDIQSDRIGLDAISWQHEYLNIPSSNSDDAFFTRALFDNNSVIKEAWYPATPEEFASGKKNILPFEENEIRIVGVDVALSRSTKKSNNDLTAIECYRIIPQKEKGYKRKSCFIETYNGANTVEQAVRIRQVMNDFEAEYLVLDCKGVGKGIYDVLTDDLLDPIRGVTYPAIKVMKHPSISSEVYDDLVQRAIQQGAKEVIYAYIGTDKNNSAMWFALKENLRLKRIEFLIDELEADTLLSKQMQAAWLEDEFRRTRLLAPFKETGKLMSEAIALEKKITTGYLKLIEPSRSRKDRIVCAGMANYFIDFLQTEYLQGFNEEDIYGFIEGLNRGGVRGGFDPGSGIFS